MAKSYLKPVKRVFSASKCQHVYEIGRQHSIHQFNLPFFCTLNTKNPKYMFRAYEVQLLSLVFIWGWFTTNYTCRG